MFKWKSYPSFRGESKVQTWMYRIALNTCVSFLRKAGKSPKMQSLTEDQLTLPDETESLNKKILSEIMENRYHTAKEKLMKYEVLYLVLSVVFACITPLYYFTQLFSLAGCLMFSGLFVLAALWQVYKIVLLKQMKMDVCATSDLLEKALKFKIVTRLRTVVGLSLLVPFFAAFLWVSPMLLQPIILAGMGVGLFVGLIIGLADYFRNQKDIDKLIHCYRDLGSM